MESSTQQQTGEETTQFEIARARRKYMILFIAKCVTGILLLLLGGLAIGYTHDDHHHTPYYVGAFLAGLTMFPASLMDMFMYRTSSSDDSATLQKISRYTCVEVFLTSISIIGGFIGIVFVSLFGVPGCGMSNWKCHYKVNISTNHGLAIAILIFLLANEIIAVASIVSHCRACKGLGKYNMLKARHQKEGQRYNTDDFVNTLHEQNSLLRKQITLQQEQLQLMQQQQQQQGSSSSALPPLPPSYESCLQDPAQVQVLQDQNEELQNRCKSQQQELTEKTPLCEGRQTTPSAPTVSHSGHAAV